MAGSYLDHEFTGNGNSAEFVHFGGRIAFSRHDDTGTTGTTVVAFQPEGQDNWQTIPNTTLTASEGLIITKPRGKFRATLSSHSGNSVWVQFQNGV